MKLWELWEVTEDKVYVSVYTDKDHCAKTCFLMDIHDFREVELDSEIIDVQSTSAGKLWVQVMIDGIEYDTDDCHNRRYIVDGEKLDGLYRGKHYFQTYEDAVEFLANFKERDREQCMVTLGVSKSESPRATMQEAIDEFFDYLDDCGVGKLF